MIARSITADNTTTSEAYIYSNGQIVLEYNTSGSADVVKAVNLWGANVDELVATERLALSTNESKQILWSYGDHLNSIRDVAIYDPTTETTTTVNHFIFDAFGNLVSSVDPTNSNATISPLIAFRYTGKYFDTNTNLQNNLNRWYDVTTGKWISVDPIGFDGGDVNLYRYVENEIINNGDSTGLDSSADNKQIEDQYRAKFAQAILGFKNKGDFYSAALYQIFIDQNFTSKEKIPNVDMSGYKMFIKDNQSYRQSIYQLLADKVLGYLTEGKIQESEKFEKYFYTGNLFYSLGNGHFEYHNLNVSSYSKKYQFRGNSVISITHQIKIDFIMKLSDTFSFGYNPQNYSTLNGIVNMGREPIYNRSPLYSAGNKLQNDYNYKPFTHFAEWQESIQFVVKECISFDTFNKSYYTVKVVENGLVVFTSDTYTLGYSNDKLK